MTAVLSGECGNSSQTRSAASVLRSSRLRCWLGWGISGLFARSVFRLSTLQHLITPLVVWQTQMGAAFALAAALVGASAIATNHSD